MILICFYDNTIKIFSWQSKYFSNIDPGSEFFSAKYAQFPLILNKRIKNKIKWCTVIINFWDKPYERKNSKSDSNTASLSAQFCQEIERCQLLKSVKYFSFLQPTKNDVVFEYVP